MKSSNILSVFISCIALAFAPIVNAQTQDTIRIDLNSLEASYAAGMQQIEIPVYFTGESSQVSAMDFWFDFNTTKLTYINTLSNQLNADPFTFATNETGYLSNTTSSDNNEDFFNANATLVTLVFELNDPCSEVLLSDFSNSEGLVNGEVATIDWTSPIPISGSIVINSPEPYCAGNSIEFEFSDVINGQDIVTYNWDIQGTSGTTAVIENTFNSPGAFSPNLLINTEAGCQMSFSTDLVIAAGPVVNFTWDGSLVNEAITFTNSTTFLEGNVLSYAWSFGDNSNSTQTNPSHTYSAEGIYEIILTALGDNGCSSQLTQELSITSSVFNNENENLLVYPNPALHMLYVQTLTPQTPVLFNSAGQRVHAHIRQIQSNFHIIDVSEISAGLYFLDCGDGHAISKVIIE